MIKILKKDNIYRRDSEFSDISFLDCTRISTQDSSWSWSENMLRHYCIALVSNGTVNFSINRNHDILLDKNTMLLIAPNTLVSARELSSSSTFWLLSFDCSDFCFFDFHTNNIKTKASDSIISMFFQLGSNIAHDTKPHYYYEALLILIIDEIKHRIISEPNKREIYENVCKYISDHISEELTVQKISNAMNYNKDYLSHIIRECNNSNIRTLIIEEKLGTAKNLLRMTNYSCEKIAKHIGIQSGNKFVQFFKYHTGESPGSYRNRNKYAL